MWLQSTHIVLDVRLAAAEEEDAAGLVVAVLAAEMERCKPAPVLDVRVGLALGQKLDRLGEALPGGLV